MLITILNGLTYAGLLFLIAVGFALVFGVMRVVNMSHGVMYLFGAYIGLEVQNRTGGNWFLAVAAAAVAVAFMAVLLERLVKFVHDDMSQTLLTLGVTLALSDLCLWIWGGLPSTLKPPSFLTSTIPFLGIKFPAFRLAMLGIAILLGLVIWYVMSRTQLGRLLRAGVDDRAMLAATGVNVSRVFTATWIIGGVLVGIAAAVGGSYVAFGPGTEFSMLTLALVVVISGGLGSIAGSAVGALIVGLVDALGRTYAAELSSFLLMGTLVIVLAIRPNGLFGKAQA